MSGRDLHQLAAIVAAESHGARATPELILREIAKMRSKTSTETADLGWDDLVLPEEVKKQFLTLGKELKNAELLASLNIRTPSGALLYGPPGTGKTQLARVLARESGLAFISASTSDIKKGYLGQSGQAVRELFERARAQSPCILFVDEFESVAGSRSGAGANAIDSEIVGELLQAMDGAKAASGLVFVMAATNHPDLVDSAILSRLERKFELPLPDAPAREAIALALLRGKPLAFEPAEGAALAARLSEGRSGRDLRSLIEAAAMAAVRRELAENDVIGELMKIELSDIEQASGSLGDPAD
jgi:transitional endoplasmic reticulum ATPase